MSQNELPTAHHKADGPGSKWVYLNGRSDAVELQSRSGTASKIRGALKSVGGKVYQEAKARPDMAHELLKHVCLLAGPAKLPCDLVEDAATTGAALFGGGDETSEDPSEEDSSTEDQAMSGTDPNTMGDATDGAAPGTAGASSDGASCEKVQSAKGSATDDSTETNHQHIDGSDTVKMKRDDPPTSPTPSSSPAPGPTSAPAPGPSIPPTPTPSLSPSPSPSPSPLPSSAEPAKPTADQNGKGTTFRQGNTDNDHSNISGTLSGDQISCPVSGLSHDDMARICAWIPGYKPPRKGGKVDNGGSSGNGSNGFNGRNGRNGSKGGKARNQRSLAGPHKRDDGPDTCACNCNFSKRESFEQERAAQLLLARGGPVAEARVEPGCQIIQHSKTGKASYRGSCENSKISGVPVMKVLSPA